LTASFATIFGEINPAQEDVKCTFKKISVGQKVVGQTPWLAHSKQKVGGQLPALPNRLRCQWYLCALKS